MNQWISKGVDYSTYFSQLETCVDLKTTTGSEKTETRIEYTRLNLQRMKRWNKTLTLLPETRTAFEAITKPMIWLVLTEAWCGDSAQIIPVIHALSRLSPHIQLLFLYRDENPELMDQYLTNRTRSIPKLIAFDQETGKELFTWGPRPEPLQNMVLKQKQGPIIGRDLLFQIHQWYAKNKGHDIQMEFNTILKALNL